MVPEFSGTAAHTKCGGPALCGKSSYWRHEHCTHRLIESNTTGSGPLFAARGWFGFQSMMVSAMPSYPYVEGTIELFAADTF